jgi:histidyl-tRNA synthetase
MSILSSLSGYPEWLPEDRLVEQAFVELIQSKFELYGFTPLETRAVEPLPVLLAKGETDKEIYLLRRLQASENESDQGVGLHFDLTVPLARYVVENRSKLVFPFRRYQIQKAWRGETPGLGRYREFLQADIDIVDEQPLTIHSDQEIVQTVNEVLTSLPIPEIQLLVNHRKILEGIYEGLGIDAITDVLRLMDKLDKVGEANVYQQLLALGLSDQTAGKCLQAGKIHGQDGDRLYQAIKALGVTHPLLDEGFDELGYLLTVCNHHTKSAVYADLSIARGLDYYTGMVCEGRFVQFPHYPTIVAGGRYDNLVTDETLKLPGVGVSIGVTRILGLVLGEGLLKCSRKTPSCVLIALISDALRDKSMETARVLRSRGICCEVFPRPVRYGKQIAYADKKGIPYVWFPDETGQSTGEVRDIRTGNQVAADPMMWIPGSNDFSVRVRKNAVALQELLERGAYR